MQMVEMDVHKVKEVVKREEFSLRITAWKEHMEVLGRDRHQHPARAYSADNSGTDNSEGHSVADGMMNPPHDHALAPATVSDEAKLPVRQVSLVGPYLAIGNNLLHLMCHTVDGILWFKGRAMEEDFGSRMWCAVT